MLPSSYNVPAIQTQDALESFIKAAINNGEDGRDLINLVQLAGAPERHAIRHHALDENYIRVILATFGIFNLPLNIYQMMHDASPRNNSRYEVEDAKQRVQRILLQWMADVMPNWQLETFCDLSGIEAQAIHSHLHWGMWIKVRKIADRKEYSNPRECISMDSPLRNRLY